MKNYCCSLYPSHESYDTAITSITKAYPHLFKQHAEKVKADKEDIEDRNPKRAKLPTSLHVNFFYNEIYFLKSLSR